LHYRRAQRVAAKSAAADIAAIERLLVRARAGKRRRE
jgi:hypothetical protein